MLLPTLALMKRHHQRGRPEGLALSASRLQFPLHSASWHVLACSESRIGPTAGPLRLFTCVPCEFRGCGSTGCYAGLLDRIGDTCAPRFIASDGQVVGRTQTAYVLVLDFDLVPESIRPDVASHLADDGRARRHLTAAGASVETVYSLLGCRWEARKGIFTVAVEVPPNTLTTVHLPHAQLSQVQEGIGVLRFSNGTYSAHDEGNTVIVEVGSDPYSLVICRRPP